jgi:hypothetical protein
MESLFTRRRRPLKPATVYGWQHCLDRWVLSNLGNKLVSEVGNGALRQFVEILTAAGLAPKTIVNVVTVVKFVVGSTVDEEGNQIHPRVCMATSSRREPDGFLTSATRSKRCKEQGSEGDSTPSGAFGLLYFAEQDVPEKSSLASEHRRCRCARTCTPRPADVKSFWENQCWSWS